MFVEGGKKENRKGREINERKRKREMRKEREKRVKGESRRASSPDL